MASFNVYARSLGVNILCGIIGDLEVRQDLDDVNCLLLSFLDVV